LCELGVNPLSVTVPLLACSPKCYHKQFWSWTWIKY